VLELTDSEEPSQKNVAEGANMDEIESDNESALEFVESTIAKDKKPSSPDGSSIGILQGNHEERYVLLIEVYRYAYFFFLSS
jgi:hypothetical protein